MIANKPSIPTEWVDEDDAPDLSAPEWQARIAALPGRRGRPNSPHGKTSTTIRLDNDVLQHFRSGGPGWQSRINEALRAVIAKR